jgi:hypothetical protein
MKNKHKISHIRVFKIFYLKHSDICHDFKQVSINRSNYIHDLGYVESLRVIRPFLYRLLMKLLIQFFRELSHSILAISETTKEDIVKRFLVFI